MRELGHSDWMAISVVIFFFGLMGLWIINDIVSVQTHIIQTECPDNTYGVTNGFWELDFLQAYHLGLYFGIVSLILLLLIIIHITFMGGGL